ncbi:MAG: pyridoxal-phosphate dependent enzyme [Candidatus Pacebacteria bacterium]|nr:pyridoxal-phosphate dependent enzyme [Candidatus Paceibacterota bacterium]
MISKSYMLDFLFKNPKKQGGIWKYADFYAEKIGEKDRLILGDGNTPLEENRSINNILGIEHLYFKREDKNECGSLKGRSLAYQISLAKERGFKNITISTSGNAGIATAAYARKANMRAFIFISPDTDEAKVADIQKYNPITIKSKRAIRLANYVAAKYTMPNLRPSLDDDSIEGFKSIAFEITDEVGDVDAVFTFVTSGSSFIGMYRGFEKYFAMEKNRKIPKMYAVQSGEIFSIAEEFDENRDNINSINNPNEDEESRAGRLGVKNTARKKEVLDIIKKTGGRGVYVSAEEITEARNILESKGVQTSPEGCASLAGFIKTQDKEKFEKAACIFSGKLRKTGVRVDETKIYSAENFKEVDEIVKNYIR